jgi:hypothetical protein
LNFILVNDSRLAEIYSNTIASISANQSKVPPLSFADSSSAFGGSRGGANQMSSGSADTNGLTAPVIADYSWEMPGANEYTVWSTDSNGDYITNLIGAVSGTSTALESLESVFNQDLNGDGVIGLYAAPGTTLQIDVPMAGTSGSATIGTGATLELTTADSASVTFAGSTGTLRLDQPSTFTGTVSGFGAQDAIDLPGIAFDAQTTLGYLPNGNQTGGILTLTNGTHSANIAFLGNYMASSFATVSDNSGGTMVVTEASQAGNQSLLTNPQHA